MSVVLGDGGLTWVSDLGTAWWSLQPGEIFPGKNKIKK